jgi:hypothetical protein
LFELSAAAVSAVPMTHTVTATALRWENSSTPAVTEATSANPAEVDAIVTADADDVRPRAAVKARFAEIHSSVNVPATSPRLRPRDASSAARVPSLPPEGLCALSLVRFAAIIPPYSTNEHTHDLMESDGKVPKSEMVVVVVAAAAAAGTEEDVSVFACLHTWARRTRYTFSQHRPCCFRSSKRMVKVLAADGGGTGRDGAGEVRARLTW